MGVSATADLESIYLEYGDMVKAYLIRMCANEDLANELTQETFYQAVKSINRFDGACSVSTWLCSIAKHLYYDFLRRNKPTEKLPENLSANDDFTEQLCRKDQAAAAHRILHSMEEPYREVFTLRTFCDLSHAEIGALFKKSESWSRTTYYRARQMLRAAMMEDEV